VKVTLVNMTLDPLRGGGTAVRTRELAAALARRGAAVTVLTSRDGDWRRIAAGLPGVRLFGVPVTGGRFRVPRGGLGAVGRAVAGTDVVMALNHWTLLNALAWRQARRAAVPFVVCPAGALGLRGRSRAAKRLYQRLVGRRMVESAAAHVAVAPSELADFAAFGVSPEAVVVIPNGVDPEPFPDDLQPDGRDSGDRLPLPGAGAPTMLFLGRLAPIKGPDLLVDAFLDRQDDLRGWHLSLAGPDDGLEAALRRRVRSAGAEGRIHFLGYVAGRRKRQALAAAELVVIPSRQEAMSIVVLEAGAAGKPVLLTDRCGLPEVAQTGGGWVVAATRQAIGDGLVEAAADRERLAARGRTWRRWVLDRYTWDRAAQSHLELFGRLAAARTPV
jgi:glycosyltransferase involved in cell wall biosynthesis